MFNSDLKKHAIEALERAGRIYPNLPNSYTHSYAVI